MTQNDSSNDITQSILEDSTRNKSQIISSHPSLKEIKNPISLHQRNFSAFDKNIKIPEKYASYQEKLYQEKRKKKLIKHCADDPEDRKEIEEVEDYPTDELKLRYSFKDDQSFLEAYIARFFLPYLTVVKSARFTMTSKLELTNQQKQDIVNV